MNITGTCVSIENNVEIQKQAGGVYTGTRLAYRDESGALKEQNFHNNALKFNPKLKVQLGNLAPNETFTMVKEKDGEFWKVMSITAGAPQQEDVTSSSTPAKGATPAAPYKSTYETPEERAKKQVYIVRQSSISAAINFVDTKKVSVADVLSVAKQFEDYVFGATTADEDLDVMGLVSDDLNID